jgi:hypothetical protein
VLIQSRLAHGHEVGVVVIAALPLKREAPTSWGRHKLALCVEQARPEMSSGALFLRSRVKCQPFGHRVRGRYARLGSLVPVHGRRKRTLARTESL